METIMGAGMDKQLVCRILVYILGLLTMAFGVVFSINSDLGVSPIVSLPLVISEIMGITIGTITTATFAFLILLQILILRKDFKWYNLSQIVFSFIFGYFMDFAIFLHGGFAFASYPGRFLMMVIGFVLISLGIVFFMEAKLVPLPVEGLCDALTQATGIKFYIYKIIVDAAFVVLALGLTFLFLPGIVGIREGTVIGMILVGKLIPHLTNAFLQFLQRIKAL